MNGRIQHEDTPEGKIGAVANALCVQMIGEFGHPPGAGDFRDAIRPWIEWYLLTARIDEARKAGGMALTAHVLELANKRAAIKFPNEYKLYEP